MAQSEHIYTPRIKKLLFSLKSQRIPMMQSESIFSKGLTKSLKYFFQNNATLPCAGLPDKIDGLSSEMTAMQL